MALPESIPAGYETSLKVWKSTTNTLEAQPSTTEIGHYQRINCQVGPAVGASIYQSIAGIYIVLLQGKYSEIISTEKCSLEQYIIIVTTGPAGENIGKIGGYSKQGPQSREPYSVWWRCEHMAPQSHFCMLNGEIGNQSQPKLG